MNRSARWFVEQIVLAARTVASKSIGHPTRTVAELQRQIHDDLRRQHPEWVEPGGESPMCDFYEARLRRLLKTCARPKLLNSISVLKLVRRPGSLAPTLVTNASPARTLLCLPRCSIHEAGSLIRSLHSANWARAAW